MDDLDLRQVSIRLEEAHLDGTLSHALDWAARLRLPLRVVATMWRSDADPTPLTSPAKGTKQPRPAALAARIESCEKECRKRGVCLETTVWQRDDAAAARQFLRPSGLSVIGVTGLPPHGDQDLRDAIVTPDLFLLMCSPLYRAIRRVLIVLAEDSMGQHFLQAAVSLCNALDVSPIVLVVARTEREAQLRRGYVEGTLAAFHQRAETDIILGWDVLTAVGRVAHWRDCSHVFLERRRLPLWLRWLRGNLLDRLRPLTDALSFLVIPEQPVSARPAVNAARR